MEQKKHRTWLCNVLFLDIVGYSKLSVERQMAVSEHFYGLVEEGLANLEREECITVDTGDGMAICYLGDPEEILLVAISLRDAFKNHDHTLTPYNVRLGINLGPVKIVELQGERRVIGDAINVAQRIMDFAKPNQLLVSRSFYEVVSCVSENYLAMFNYLGMHADKHVRQHAVYEIVPEGEARSEVVASQTPANQESPAPPAGASPGVPFDEAQLTQVANQLADYIGPLALLLVKKAAKEVNSLADLYNVLAEDALHTEEQKRQFLDSRRTLH
ncbi:MAG: adenylate/guanylate cyclase domain-containing protein [Nitrospirales bacterium]